MTLDQILTGHQAKAYYFDWEWKELAVKDSLSGSYYRYRYEGPDSYRFIGVTSYLEKSNSRLTVKTKDRAKLLKELEQAVKPKADSQERWYPDRNTTLRE